MPHPYYQPRQNHRYPNQPNDTVSQAERLSDRTPSRVRRRASANERISSYYSIRGGPPTGSNSESRHGGNRRGANMPSSLPPFWHVYPSGAIPTQLLHSLPVHPLPYPSPLYVLTPVVPEPRHVYPTTTQTTSSTVPPTKSHTRPDRSSTRVKRSPVKLPSTTVEPGPTQSAAGTTTQAQSHLPRSPKSYTFHCHKPGSTVHGYPYPQCQTNNVFSAHTEAPNLTRMPGEAAWESHEQCRKTEVPYPLPIFCYVLPLMPRGLVLPRAEDSQMNWPPKDLKLESRQWMIHPCLLWVENEIVQTSWKWDMSKYPTRGSILELSPSGIVCPIGEGDLDAPVIHSPTKNQKIKLIVNDFPLKPLEFSSDNLTVGSLFLALWEFLNQHIRKDWQSWLTKCNLQYVIPTLEANRSVRLEKIGKLAAIAELGQPPKWIDVFGDLVFFGGLIPLINEDDDPQEETRVFKLRHRGWN